MRGLDNRVFAAHKDEGRPEFLSQSDSLPEAKSNELNLGDIKNWEEKDGLICAKNIEAFPTPLWHDGWYRNPTSGRSSNYGVNTEKPQDHFTVVIKGGCFFVDEKTKQFFEKNPVSLDELYGGISFERAKKEHDIAALIQEQFKTLLNKKANCPEPINVKAVTHVLNERNETVELADFFVSEAERDEGKTKFTITNLVKYAMKLGVDVFYPLGEEVDKSIQENAFHWLFSQCFEKNQQGVYQYKIDGPNTRILDLMTLSLADRQRYFIEANNALDINDAVEKFSSKLGEFYGVLHKSNISYHGKSSEHCTLVDITISGVIMDIGGLTQDNSVDKRSDSYAAQLIKTTNLISYLCTNILKVDGTVLDTALNIFVEKYGNLYRDRSVEYFSKRTPDEPDKIRTQYLDVLASDWITLAPDLRDLTYAG